MIHLVAERLFRRHVTRRPGDDAGRAIDGSQPTTHPGRRGPNLSRARNRRSYEAVLADHDVFGLDVAVDDAGRVRGAETGRDLAAYRDSSGTGTGARLITLRSVSPSTSSEATNSCGPARPISKMVTMFGWFSGGRGARFLSESKLEAVVSLKTGREELEGHIAAEHGIGRPIHVTHAARSQVGDHAIAADPPPN